MAPFQLRVRPLYPCTVSAIVHLTRSSASVRCSPWPGPHSARRLHSETTLPQAQDDDATSPDTGNAACRVHTSPGRSGSGASSSSYSDTASCPAGHTAGLLAGTSMAKSAAGLTGPSPSSASPGARPPTLTSSVPRSSASHPFRPDPSCRTTAPKDRSLALSRITPTVTPASARWRDLHVGDHLHGVALFARLRCTSYPFPLCCRSPPGRAASAASTTEPPWAPSALSAPSPLAHRRHRLRDDRLRADPHGTAHAPLQQSVLLHLHHRRLNLSTSRTRLARTPTAGDAHHLNARPRTPMPSPLSLRYRWADHL